MHSCKLWQGSYCYKHISSNTSAEEVSEACGMKIYRQNWGKKIGRTTPLTFNGI